MHLLKILYKWVTHNLSVFLWPINIMQLTFHLPNSRICLFPCANLKGYKRFVWECLRRQHWHPAQCCPIGQVWIYTQHTGRVIVACWHVIVDWSAIIMQSELLIFDRSASDESLSYLWSVDSQRDLSSVATLFSAPTCPSVILRFSSVCVCWLMCNGERWFHELTNKQYEMGIISLGIVLAPYSSPPHWQAIKATAQQAMAFTRAFV